MTNITIPTTIAEAGPRLTSLDNLATATEWERAAIVSAFVEESSKPGPQSSTRTSRTPGEFAGLGFAGLKSKDTVRRYVQAWLDQRPRPRPGDTINLDGLPDWPTRYGDGKEKHGAARSPGQTAGAMSDPHFVAKVVEKMTPEAAQTIADALVNNPETHLAIARAQGTRAEKEGVRQPKPRQDEDFAGVDFLLLQAAKQHVRDFARKLAAARAALADDGQLPYEIQRMINEDIDDLIRYLTEIKALTNGEIRLHMTDEDFAALLGEG